MFGIRVMSALQNVPKALSRECGKRAAKGDIVTWFPKIYL